MRRKATLEAVMAAIRQLMAEGDATPSLDSIVSIVGGSKGTVQQIVAVHRASIEALREEALPVPSTVRDEFRNLQMSVWASAEYEARLRARDAQDSMERLQATLQTHLERQIDANVALAIAVAEQEDEIASLEARLDASGATVRSLEEAAADLRHRLDAATASAAAKSDLVSTLRELGLTLPAAAAPADAELSDPKSGNGKQSADKRDSRQTHIMDVIDPGSRDDRG